jgi:hypothetical protein
MAIAAIWTALCVAYVGFCVWLAIRIVNRRERWAKRTAIAMAIVPLLYVLSSGPAKTLAFHGHTTVTQTAPGGPMAAEMTLTISDWWLQVYAPLWWVSEQCSVHSWTDPLDLYWGLFPIRSDRNH